MKKDLLTIKDLEYKQIYINTISLLDVQEVIGLLELEYKGNKTILYAHNNFLGLCNMKDVLDNDKVDKIKRKMDLKIQIETLERELRSL